MYAFIDRHVSELDGGGHLMVRAMRQWVTAMHRRACPSADVGTLFAAQDIVDALPHFHLSMVILNRHAINDISFGRPECRHIHDGESLILAIISGIMTESADRTQATLALVVEGEWIRPLHVALRALVDRLVRNNLLPGAPAAVQSRTGDAS